MIFIVMEYCYNGDLFNYMSKHGQLSEERVSEYTDIYIEFCSKSFGPLEAATTNA